MQEFFSRVSNFFLDCLPQASLGEVPPERLPRRAVQGFGGAQPPYEIRQRKNDAVTQIAKS